MTMSNVPHRRDDVRASRGEGAAARPGRRLLGLYLTVAIIVVVLDRVSKLAAEAGLADGSRHVLIPHVLDLYLVHNTGAAFSMGEGAGWFFVLVAVAVVVLSLRYVLMSDEVTPALAGTLGAIAGGGVGNMVDRLVQGSVTDFLATSFIRFPVFNVADIAVTCGVFVMLVLVWRMGPEEGE